MWAVAAPTSESYKPFQDLFYQRARKYAQLDEMKSYGELGCTPAHAQAWAFIAMYEQTHMYLTRGYLSGRKAAAICIATGLHKLDGVGLTTTQVSSPPEDWVEMEERRRTFWLIFTHDKYLCIGSGWPPAIDEGDVSETLGRRDDL